jgi:hypothetical protein
MDLEDLIMYRFEQAGTSYFLEAYRKYSGVSDFNFKDYNGIAPHQYTFCLNMIGQNILDCETSVLNKKALSKESYNKDIKPYFLKGYGAFLGTKLTSSGHVVSLDCIYEDGITINDPYGLFGTTKGEYICNGMLLNASSKKLILENPKNFASKLRYNKELYDFLLESVNDKVNTIKMPHKLGIKNFYNWEQISKYEIGWWISLINKK